jgi:hypothetical protein
VPDGVRKRELETASAVLATLSPALDAYAAARADALADDHTRVRQALGSKAAVKVQAVTPLDIIGLYVLMPRL